MLRYAISEGRFSPDSPPSNVCHSERSEEPQYCTPSPSPHTRLLAHAAHAAAQQIDFFLLRDPTLPAGTLATLARELLTVFAPTRTLLLLHSRPDIAIATHAHGVHLPSTHDALTPAQVRHLYATARLPDPVISLSCHTEADLHRAVALQPNLILFGPIFGKQVENHTIHPGIGLEPLRQACRLAHPIPILALGGITQSTIPPCLEAGAAGIAAIRLFQAH